MASADAWLARVAPSIVAGLPLESQIAASLLLRHPTEHLVRKSWMAESCGGSYPLEVADSSRSPGNDALAAGSFFVLSIEFTVDDVPWLGAAPMFVRA